MLANFRNNLYTVTVHIPLTSETISSIISFGYSLQCCLSRRNRGDHRFCQMNRRHVTRCVGLITDSIRVCDDTIRLIVQRFQTSIHFTTLQELFRVISRRCSLRTSDQLIDTSLSCRWGRFRLVRTTPLCVASAKLKTPQPFSFEIPVPFVDAEV